MAEDDDQKEIDIIIGPPGYSEAESVEFARERFQRLGEETKSRYRKLSEDVRRGAERASQEIRRGEERARGTYEKVGENAQGKVYSQVRSLSHEISRLVRDNPGKALLISASFGFLLGLLPRRDRDPDE
jgi:ElaB/YqjD/DUF883 family membrane-anchored ribosome-binding protein